MKRKDTIQSLILIKQNELPFLLKDRELELPVDTNKIITVAGVRRCGKSSLMKIAINKLVENGLDRRKILWLGFDDERLFDIHTDELDEIITAYMEMYPDIPLRDVYMFFDEIQLVPHWELFVLRLYKSYCQHIFISGSNSQMLSDELSTVLRGWPLNYVEYPLSFKEYCQFKNIKTKLFTETDRILLKRAFNEYSHEGGYPEVVLSENQSIKDKILQEYFNAMLYRDLIEHYQIKNPEVVRYFMKRLMSSLSTPIGVNSVYNDLKSMGYKIGKDMLYKLSDQLCSIFMFMRLPKYDRSLKKINNALSKYYVIDNGLRQSVLSPQSSDNGKLLENTVFLQLRRKLLPNESLYYYRGNKDEECDFVIQQNGTVKELIQVTWDIQETSTRSRELLGLLTASEDLKCNKLTILTYEEEEIIHQNNQTIHVIPVWKWLLE